ncbi:MAG: hypothetical protein NZ700_10955 [Gemmataceae bacterium]|nr:hypothetical protein [Gemmataceae bacterium]MDW8264971.1 hypothetical protein [Gemmataceae bacterium]
MSTVTIRCPACGREGKIHEKYLGRQARCKTCKQTFTLMQQVPGAARLANQQEQPLLSPPPASSSPPPLPSLPPRPGDDSWHSPLRESQNYQDPVIQPHEIELHYPFRVPKVLPVPAHRQEPAPVVVVPTQSIGRPINRWLVISCAVVVLVCGGGLAFLLVGLLTQSTSPAVPFTEAGARDQLKRALTAWVTGGTPQTLAQAHPDIEFVDPLFSDGAVLLGYDIERSYFFGMDAKCDVRVSLKYRQVNGKDERFTRLYEVAKPDERGIWRITVSQHTPKAPSDSKPSPVAKARHRLETALDAWVARIWKKAFAVQHPEIDFLDVDYSVRNIVVRYHIVGVEGSSFLGPWSFHVLLVFLSDEQTEITVFKIYEVDRPNERGIWHIRGYRPLW